MSSHGLFAAQTIPGTFETLDRRKVNARISRGSDAHEDSAVMLCHLGMALADKEIIARVIKSNN